MKKKEMVKRKIMVEGEWMDEEGRRRRCEEGVRRNRGGMDSGERGEKGRQQSKGG